MSETTTTVYADRTGWVRTWVGPEAIERARRYASTMHSDDTTVTLFISAPDRAQVIATKRKAA